MDNSNSDSSSPVDDNIIDVLDQVSSLIDANEEEQVDLFSDIHLTPKSPDAPLKLIKLLTLLIKSRLSCPKIKFPKKTSKEGDSNSTVNRLVSYLKSHVALLQAITHNADLATLFLVGQNGMQSFTELQKSTLLEQTARTRNFIASIKSHSKDTCLMDYTKYLNDIKSLPERLKELKSIKKQIKKSESVESLKNSANEVISILETALLFNDILLQNKTSKQRKNEGNNENKQLFFDSNRPKSNSCKYKKEIRKLRCHIEHLQIECADKDGQISALQKDLNELKSINNNLSSRIKENSKKDDQISSKFENLQVQKDQLANDLNSLKTKVICDNQTAEVVRKLKEKLQKVEAENRKMRLLLDETVANHRHLNDQIDSSSNELKRDLQQKQHENSLLKQQVNQLQDQISNYQNSGCQSEQKIGKLTDKIDSLNTQIGDLTRAQNRLQTRANDLENMYKDVSAQLEQSERLKSEITNQINKLRKELKTKAYENDELKAMLDRVTADSQKQMADNATLIKQLRRCDSNTKNSLNNADEVAKLKEKLRSACAFIKKLQEQITDYKNRMKCDKVNEYNNSNNNYYDDNYDNNNYHHITRVNKYQNEENYKEENIDGKSPFSYNALDSKLNDLNVTIHQLEKTVHRSRKDTGLSSSSE